MKLVRRIRLKKQIGDNGRNAFKIARICSNCKARHPDVDEVLGTIVGEYNDEHTHLLRLLFGVVSEKSGGP